MWEPESNRPRRHSVVLLLARGSGLVLRRALGDQRVAFADVADSLLVDRDYYLAPFSERIGHGSGVGDGNRSAPCAILHAEQRRSGVAVHRACDDRARELVAAPGLRLAHELTRAERRAGGAEAR